jgi:hypothetical protein
VALLVARGMSNREIARLRAPVLSNTDLRWSCTVCADRDIRAATSRVSAPVARWWSSSVSRALSPVHRANNVSRSGELDSSMVTAMSRWSRAASPSSRAARRVSQRLAARWTRAHGAAASIPVSTASNWAATL